MPPLKTFEFESNSIIITIEAYSYEGAMEFLVRTVKNPADFILKSSF